MNSKNTLTFALIVIGVVFVLNLFAQNFFFRFDLTENQRYSISDVTRDILADIDEPITVKVFYSENFPRQLISVKQYVLDMLNEYRAYAGSGLEYEFISISGEDQEMEQEAMSYGIQPVQANITESDEIKVQRIYLGIVFLYGDQKEVIPFAQQIEQLEYDMTGAIKKLSQGSLPKVGWLTGHGEQGLGEEGVARAVGEIQKNYELVEIGLHSEDQIPQDINTVILAGTNTVFEDQDLYKLDQYLLRGGRIGVFLNTKIIDMQNQYLPVQENGSNIFAFLEHFGVQYGRQLLQDKACYQVQAMQNLGFMQIPVAVDYPFAPRISNLADESPIVNRLNELGFFFVNELLPSGDTTRINFSELMLTSEMTGYAMPDQRTRSINISAAQKVPDYIYREGAKVISAVVEGEYDSWFGATRPDTLSYPEAHLASSVTPTAMVAVGNATFTTQQFMVPTSLTFFLNAVDWLYDQNGLISIRSKNVKPTQLDEMTSGTRQTLKWINILLAPILITILGLIRWFIRNKSKMLAGG
ncbi:MAG: GldG family protein [Candidatus Marinimicrobia bacterium]|nr:GldG family protein [Candidatus Neomarinimicrobiota bacterium]